VLLHIHKHKTFKNCEKYQLSLQAVNMSQSLDREPFDQDRIDHIPSLY
jgi:hypothetical protein